MTDQFERRPLVIAALAFVIGLTAIEYPANFFFLPVLLWAAKSRRAWAISAIFLGLGVWLAPKPLPVLMEPRYVSGTLTVQSVPQDYRDLQYAETSIDGERVDLQVPREPLLRFHDVLRVSGVLRPPSEGSESYYRERGLQASLKLERFQFARRGPLFFGIPGRWRRDYKSFVSGCLSSEHADLIQSLWFGAGELDRGEVDTIKQAGAYSDIGASGMHVYLLCGFVLALLALFRVPRMVQALVAVTALVVYTVATGVHPSTFRAALGCLVFLLSYRLRREGDSLSSLGLASLIYLNVFPRSVYSVGFQAVAVIVIGLCLFARLEFPQERSAIDTVKFSTKRLFVAAVIIWLASEPIFALRFHTVQFGVLPAMMLLGLVVAVLLMGSLFAYAIHGFAMPIAFGMMRMVIFPLESFFFVVTDFLKDHALQLTAPAFNGYWLVLYYGAWLFTWRPRASRP